MKGEGGRLRDVISRNTSHTWRKGALEEGRDGKEVD